VDCIDATGETALYYACLLGHGALAQALVDHGARDDPERRCFHNALDPSCLPHVLRHPHGHRRGPRQRTFRVTSPNSEWTGCPVALAERRARQEADRLQSAQSASGRTHVALKAMGWSACWPAFFEALAENPAATHLDIRKSRMGLTGAQSLAGCLRRSVRLTDVYLYRNNVGDEGVSCICQALKENPCLTKLNLCDNSLTAVAATHFAALLAHGPCGLMHLDLNRNTLGDAGATALARALPHNTTLRVLSLRTNGVTDEGARAFLQADGFVGALESLGLEDNPVAPALLAVVAEACQRSAVLRAKGADHRDRCGRTLLAMFGGDCPLPAGNGECPDDVRPH
jgi:hypothetical protein